MATIYSDEYYTVSRDPSGGAVLLHNASGHDVFFQPGDDAADFFRELDAFEAAIEQGVNVPSPVFFGPFFA